MSRYSDTSTFSQSGEWIMGAARRNPEALLLMAAGAVLLMRGGGGGSSRTYPGGRSREGDRLYPSTAGRVSGAIESAGDYASDIKDRTGSYAADVKDKASSYASDIKDRVADTASAYAGTVAGYAADAGRSVAETTQRYGRQMQSTLQSSMDWMLRDQPLAVALVGLAAGAAVAACLPSTEIENRTLGSARGALADAAGRAGENLREAAGKAGERLKSAAAERGLSSEGLKDLAGEVAGTFTEAVKGKSDDLGSATVVPESPSIRSNRTSDIAPGGSSMARANDPQGWSNR